MSDSTEIRIVKLELGQEVIQDQLEKLENRVEVLEDDHSKQVNILVKLGQTVDTLAETVATLGRLTHDLDKSQDVIKARFNIVIAILAAIGGAVITGVVKLVFFSGGGPG